LEEYLEKINNRLQQIKYIKGIKSKIKKKEYEIENSKYDFIPTIMKWLLYCPVFNVMTIRIKNHHIKYKYDLSFSEKALQITYKKFSTNERFSTDNFLKYFHWVLKWLLENKYH